MCKCHVKRSYNTFFACDKFFSMSFFNKLDEIYTSYFIAYAGLKHGGEAIRVIVLLVVTRNGVMKGRVRTTALTNFLKN